MNYFENMQRIYNYIPTYKNPIYVTFNKLNLYLKFKKPTFLRGYNIKLLKELMLSYHAGHVLS